MASPKRRSRLIACAAAFFSLALAPIAHAQNLIRDTEIESILRQQSDPIFEASGLNPRDVRILLIADKELNAFATSGQIIGLNTGLIIEADTPNQLLGVIAHEAGHLSGGHTVRGNEMQRAGLRPFLLTLGLGVLAAAAGAPDAGAALISSSTMFGTLGALTYSRVQEAAADQAAVTALDKAGYSGEGLVEFFDEFRYQEVFSEARRFSYFRSHPLSSERIGALRRRVQSMPNAGQRDDEAAIARHRIMQAKLSAFLDPPQQTFVRYRERDTSFPARYARAIAYYRATETEKALQAVDALIQEQPENPYLWELKGQILFENGRAPEAEPAHRRSVELKPDAPLLRINLAQTILALEKNDRVDDAIGELARALGAERDNVFAWGLLSQAFDRKGQPGQARLAAAERHFHLGDLRQAKVFAMRALDHLDRGTPDANRAMDIVLASDPTDEDLRSLAREGM
mgnify:CR=1 FL=1